MAFTTTLPRSQKALFWESKGPDKSMSANRLQHLFDEGDTDGYELQRKAYESEGMEFRLTKGKIFQLTDKGRMDKVDVSFQVKGGTMTWYIVAPMDETHQSFRDEVYRSAAIAHLTVSNHCERYYRGTNSLHVKKMHTREKESALNHNHYRVIHGTDVSVTDVSQHLKGMVIAQQRLGLVSEDGREKFLDKEEAQQIITAFKVHDLIVRHKGPAKSVVFEDKTVKLPARPDMSVLEEYRSHPEEQLTVEDQAEWEANKGSELPCKSIDLDEDLDDLLVKIQQSMRGIGSEKANTRQIAGSANKAIATVVPMDDRKFEGLSGASLDDDAVVDAAVKN